MTRQRKYGRSTVESLFLPDLFGSSIYRLQMYPSFTCRRSVQCLGSDPVLFFNSSAPCQIEASSQICSPSLSLSLFISLTTPELETEVVIA